MATLQITSSERDPANVLINDNLDAVLCDFGLAKFAEGSGTSLSLSTSTAIQETIRYMSPELVMKSEAKHTPESDVWAWACTVFQIITDSIPYSGILGGSDVLVAIARGSLPGSFDLLKSPALNVDNPLQSTLDTLRHLISQCWSFNPDERPSFSTILDHIEHGLENSALDLSREKSPEHLSPTRGNTLPYLNDPLSLDAGNPSILESSTAAPPASDVPEEIGEPEAPPTIPSPPSAHRQNDPSSLDTALEASTGPSPAGYVLDDIAEPEVPPTTPSATPAAPSAHHQSDPRSLDTALEPSNGPSPAGYVLDDIAEPEVPPTTPSATPAGPSAHHQNEPHPPDTALESPIGTEPPPAGYVLEGIAEPEVPPTTPSATPAAPSAYHQNDPRPPDTALESPTSTEPPPAGYVLEDIVDPDVPLSTPSAPPAHHQNDPHPPDTVLELPIGTKPPPAGYVLEGIAKPETPLTTPSAPSARHRYPPDHPEQATRATDEPVPGTLLHSQRPTAEFRRPASQSVYDNLYPAPRALPKSPEFFDAR
ncbi:hypothetical protein FRC00_013608 [Tulasnella sp. 408]|nr:hypothetical protein FRC00_013608 [Tulasnella sp. 408]